MEQDLTPIHYNTIKNLSIAAIVCSVLGLIGVCVPIVPLSLGVIGLILSILALVKAKRLKYPNMILPIAGCASSAITFVVGLVLCISAIMVASQLKNGYNEWQQEEERILNTFDSLRQNYHQNLPEADSTFYIE